MCKDIEFRKATDADVEAARALTNRSWIATYGHLIGEDETNRLIVRRHARALFKEQADAADDVFLVAEDDGEIIGHCYAFAKDGFYVDRLHVAETAKGKGVGRGLLDRAIGDVPDDTRVWLEVLKGNGAAMQFYERVGFRRTGETDACGGLAGIPAAIYERISD